MEKKLWETIANQCAPVLGDVKPSNLLILTQEELAGFDASALPEEISALCLHEGQQRSIWLLYRADRLEAELVWPQTRHFLREYGYDSCMGRLYDMLLLLRERFTEYKEGSLSFPHEMGVFLGYPLCDVKGFIEHQGKDFLCSGYWKVYKDEAKAKATFQRYQTVRDALLRMISMDASFGAVSYSAY